MIETLFQTIQTEYGVFVVFLFFTNGVLLFIIGKLWKQITYLSNQLLEVIKNNTEVLSEIKAKLDEK